jgi:cellulose synthase/poly-beta-1,6-N-acetylglucosamine synthase-like glycosyltransferase
MEFSVIVPAYRESNINKALELILKQDLPPYMKLKKIFLVASGYKQFPFLKSKKTVLINEKIRGGKATAINSALKKTNSDIVVLMSGDVLPSRNTIKKLLIPLKDSSIGMTTGRPIPLNDKKSFVGFSVHLVWFLHHLVSLQKPKAGEILAFRKLVKTIPKKLVADESYLECAISKRGYKIIYVPDAVVFNKGPENISYFLKQRRRAFIGHLHIEKNYNYSVSTMSLQRILISMLKFFEVKSVRNFKEIFWIIAASFLEFLARFLATIDFYILNKLPYKWEKIKT